MRQKRSLLAGKDQSVSFAELFFDLVFVYAITQVVHLMHGSFDLIHAARSILIFWLVWWAWTQYSWALNAGNTTHRSIQMAVLLATAIAFFMAVSVPEAFGSASLWFAAAYVAVRGIGLIMYLWVTRPNEKMRDAVRTFAAFSIAGLLSVMLGGFFGGKLKYIFWGLTILLDVMAAGIGGRNDSWNLHPRHFSERHGLFVIIALGETLIISASAVTQDYQKPYLLTITLLSIGITCCMWWLYFFRAKERLEHGMEVQQGAERSELARDVYSLLHFPLLCGLIIYSYAIGEAMLHPDQAMAFETRLALALGIGIFSIGIALTHLRATGQFLTGRVVITVLLSGIVFMMTDFPTYIIMGITLTGLVLLCIWEEIFCPFEQAPDTGLDIE